MGIRDDQPVDLAKLSERELLILTYKKVEALEVTSNHQTKKQNMTDIELAVLKTKIQLYAGLIGFASGLASSLILFYITKH